MSGYLRKHGSCSGTNTKGRKRSKAKVHVWVSLGTQKANDKEERKIRNLKGTKKIRKKRIKPGQSVSITSAQKNRSDLQKYCNCTLQKMHRNI